MQFRRVRALSFVLIALLLVPQLGLSAEKVAKKKRAPASDQDTVTPVPRDGNWMKRQEQINANVKKGGAELLLIGDSITQGWEKNGKEVWEKYYTKRHAVNLGIGGDRTQHVLWRLEHGNLDGIHPKLAVLMIGTNNAGANTPHQIANGVQAIVQKLHTKLPETKVLVLAIFPRGVNESDKARQVNMAANEEIAKFADDEHVFYLDIGPKFLEPDGSLSKEIMYDRLHLTPKGYEIWASSIEPTVAKLMGETK